MELIRTLIVALFFAGVTVLSYYFLNSYPMPWEKMETPVAQKPDASEKTLAPPEGVPEIEPLGESPFANSTSMTEDPFVALPGLDVSSDTSLSATEPLPPMTPVKPETQIGNELPALPASPASPALDVQSNPALPPSVTEELPILPAMEAVNPLRSEASLPPAVTTPAPPVVPAEPVDEKQAIQEYLQTAAQKIQKGEALEVLRALSPYYGDARFSTEESEKLVGILVQAATQVIYSQKSFLEPAYLVQPGDTLDSIARTYNIPAEFIARVNGVHGALQPGQSLKVLRGPFQAMVYLDRYEMVLTLNGLFAGRFWIGVGGNLTTFDGDFYFRQTLHQGGQAGSPLFAFEFVRNLSQIAPGTPSADSLILHPTNDTSVLGKKTAQGNILLSQDDMQSLSVLLGSNSRLTLRSQTLNMPPANPPAATASLPPMESTPNPIASPVNDSLGTQASLPGYELPPVPATAPGAPSTPATSTNALPNPLPNTPGVLSAPGTSSAPGTPSAQGALPAELPTELSY